jgi:flagellar motor switch protein FliN/FliY
MAVEVKVQLGSARLTLKDVLNLEQGSMIELTKLAGEPPLDVVLHDRIIGHGTAIALGNQLGVRITEMVPSREELPPLPEFLHPRPNDPTPFRNPDADGGGLRVRAQTAMDELDTDRHPLAVALENCARKAAGLSIPELEQVLSRLAGFVEPLNTVLFGQPTTQTTAAGETIAMKTVGEWADFFVKEWLDDVCAYHADAVIGGRDHTSAPSAVFSLLRELHSAVLSSLAENLYVEVVLVLNPGPVDPNRMTIAARLPTGGTTACAVRSAGLVVGQQVIRSAAVIVG